PRRTLPKFAPYTFRQWFDKRPQAMEPVVGAPVILWVDTFTNHFHPEIGEAAVEVMEAAGFEVKIPWQPLCCGRPLYDWGMLTEARQTLVTMLQILKPDIEAGVPVVVLEPSCASVFKDELHSFFPQNEDAKRMAAQTFLLSEFLEKKAPHYQ